MSGQSVFFREDPQKIAYAADRLRQLRNSFSGRLSSLKERSDGLEACWRGGGADEYRRKAARLDLCGRELVEVMDGFAGKLQLAGGIYSTGEQEAKTATQGLPTAGIYR
jgi:WXG100 family type VII secretion target